MKSKSRSKILWIFGETKVEPLNYKSYWWVKITEMLHWFWFKENSMRSPRDSEETIFANYKIMLIPHKLEALWLKTLDLIIDYYQIKNYYKYYNLF